MARLQLQDLRKEFDMGKIVAVSDLNLDLNDDEFVTVVGPSGCGKTTTLRMIAGLEQPTEGSIVIGDEDVTKQSARERNIAMVFQNYSLYPHKTVEQNIEFGLRMRTNLDRDERYEKVQWVAEMMGIEDLLDQSPDELSGGQKQRVALGRAIVREPEVFLFDEPLSNLDAKLRTLMRTEIQRLQNELGITSVYVTHDQEEAMTMGDRIVILNEGELQQVGQPIEVFENPINKFVAEFIGSPSMNFLDVMIERTGKMMALSGVETDLRFELSPETAQRLSDEIDGVEHLTLGIRPEDVSIADLSDDIHITTTVEVVEPIGSDVYLYLSLGDHLIARVDAGVDLNPGDSVEIAFNEEQLHFFNDAGGSLLFQKEERATPAP